MRGSKRPGWRRRHGRKGGSARRQANNGSITTAARAWRSVAASNGRAGRGLAADVQRKARLLVGVAEALLRRPVRSALEIGCGEGTWRTALRRARPGIKYTGVDSSAYVVSRFGRARGIRFGTLGSLARAELSGPFDLVICTEPLEAATTEDLSRGLRALAAYLGGVAYLEAPVAGPARHPRGGRPAAYYARLFRRAGLRPLGLHCWVGDALQEIATSLRPG